MTSNLKSSLRLLIPGLFAAIIAGCGGGGGSRSIESLGSASLTVLWPTTPDSQSIKITILNGTSSIAERTVNRPSQGDSSVADFGQLPEGDYIARVTAYSSRDAGGSPSREADPRLTILSSQTTRLSFTLSGIVDHIVPASQAASLMPHATTKLTAIPMTADGAVVLLPVGTITWASGDTGVATVDASGTVTGVASGSADITASDPGGPSAKITITVGGAKWTVMVYMAADNNLESEGILNLNQMETIGSTSDVSVVVQFDRSASYDMSNGNWSGTRRYYVTHDSDTSIIHSQLVQDLGHVDMASPLSLTDFIQWATTSYPADHYLLVLWDHGRGWRSRTVTAQATQREVKSIFVDDTSQNEMTLAGLTQALGNGHRTDIVLFDACLMGMLEVAYAVKDSADIMVASEENVPLNGQPYGTLVGRIVSNPSITADALGRDIVDDYINYYSASAGGSTFSELDLHAVDQLTAATDQLASSILANIDQARWGVETAQASAQRYDFDKNEYRSYKDLCHFAGLVKDYVSTPAVQSAAQNVITITDSAVLHEGHAGAEVVNSHGISIYLPDPDTMLSQYNGITFAQATHWDELLSSY